MRTSCFSCVLFFLCFALTATDAIAQQRNTRIPSRPVNNLDATSGLREALTSGVVNALLKSGKNDGYFGNELIKIAFPPEAQQVIGVVERVGGAQGKRLIDTLVKKLNRAAEDAANNPQTKQIFVDAIKNMTLTDGLTVLRGDSVAATTYLKGQTLAPLTNLYSPIVKQSMDKAGVQNAWTQIAQAYNGMRFFMQGSKAMPEDISQYVTQRAIEGLFTMVGREEAQIRKNPVARTTDLLKKVFGGRF